MDNQNDRAAVLAKLAMEEETENSLIWLYDSLLDMGVVNCFPPDRGAQIREGMKVLADESREHRLVIDRIKENYQH